MKAIVIETQDVIDVKYFDYDDDLKSYLFQDVTNGRLYISNELLFIEENKEKKLLSVQEAIEDFRKNFKEERIDLHYFFQMLQGLVEQNSRYNLDLSELKLKIYGLAYRLDCSIKKITD